jgi:Fe-S-cluster containining protein
LKPKDPVQVDFVYSGRIRRESEHVKIQYPVNIRWQCIRCHTCCGDTKQHTRHVRMLDTEVKAISRLTGLNPRSFCVTLDSIEPYRSEMLKQASGDCIFLKGPSCVIYNERPLTCKFYPFYLEEHSIGNIVFDLTSEKCPGLGQGPLLSTEFFVEMLRTASKQMTSR